ncbi:NADPH dehydrogenase NamA [Brevibacillus laterosporus]|uniref:NADPH dehydrogenase NamA n=1 Tax=Brevibacillus laterosporus TaxID=1465 RepID=UPI00264C61EA|nr:NADPH dehydrogenase NamA [Brevibacillus laterosporus]MDN9011647.1 NADPH dehydrogenase NamA [Brevibacillus laterosporus]MDO0942647.1 NADPH dehydrogenase NamA [Brevibacillus laterosporus]
MTVKLFQPYQLKEVTLKNRIVMAPMCMYSATEKDGKATEFHITHYATRAVGQVGLIIVEATAVEAQGRISEFDLGIWNDDHIAGLHKIVEQAHQYGAKIGIQLAHAGRKAEVPGSIFGPSAIAFDESSRVPEEMSVEKIKQTIEAFKQGAARAKQAGFDVIEIHAAHGYLLHEFLSPLSNQRTDEYGGSQENRYRMLSKVITEVKSVWEGPLMVRVSATDYTEGGLTIEDHVQFAAWMRDQGVDLIDVSSGALVRAAIHVYPGYQVKLSEQIKEEANIPTGAVGLITSPLQAEEILQNNRADLIILGRELLRNPYWARGAADELQVEIEAPRQYQRGW